MGHARVPLKKPSKTLYFARVLVVFIITQFETVKKNEQFTVVQIVEVARPRNEGKRSITSKENTVTDDYAHPT
jgi:hypothetical protein